MAEGQVKQILEKEVTCALCLDLFKEPKKLPCDHVYCRECLRGLALRSLNATISCPECRTLTQVPGNDVNSFPTAFQTNRLIEAFQQVQIRVETDSPNVTEMCHVHPTQPLAIYCETCKKQLCRDCVLMSKEHTNHEYGFFEKVAPKHREKVGLELSLIKAQKSSISSALGEIAAVERSIADHAQICQDDVEYSFEELISVLKTCKQAIKDETTAYYSSITGVFDQQKERLKDIESKIELVVTSVDTTLQDDDQGFLVRLQSTFEKMSDLQKQFQAASLTVAQPQLIGIQTSAESLKQHMKENCFIYKLAQADMCSLDGSFTNRLYVDDQFSFILTLRNSSGNVCQDGANRMEIELVKFDTQGSLTKGDAAALLNGQVKILLTPKTRGKHQLNVKVNGAHIKNSPFTVTVYMPPERLSKPLTTISGLKHPCSLRCSRDKILASEIRKSRIIQIDSKFQVQELHMLMEASPSELTQDSDLNIYATTGNYHKVMKLSNAGSIIKVIGVLGKRHAEFNFPNGLRVNTKHELYVCDSRNDRVQNF